MPITPGAAGASFDVLLAFSLDEEANKRVQARVSTLEEELKRLQEAAGGVTKEYKKTGEEVKKSNKEIAASFISEARLMKREAAALTSDLRAAQIGALKTVSGLIGGLSQKALITGTLITGGIFAEANRFAKEQEGLGKSTALTQEWTQATQELGRARSSVDTLLLKEALPLLQQAAKVATQASAFVQSHPEIVSAALKTGLVLAGLGAVGTLVSKGIKLTADALYLATIPAQLAAAKLQDSAADKQLAAAGMKSGPLGALKGAGLGAALPIAGAVGANVLGSALLAKELDHLDKTLIDRFGAIGKTVSTILEVALTPIFPILGPLRGLQRETPKVTEFVKKLLGIGDAAKEAGDDLSQAAGQIAGSVNEAKIVEAFGSWKEDDARLVAEAADNRKKILEEAERDIAKSARDYASQRVSINERFNKAAGDLRRRFEEENTRAEEQYQTDRADAIRSSAERIQEIEIEARERQAQAAKDHADREDELSRSRDALGLVKERRAFEDQRVEEDRATRLSVDQVKRETAARLAEIDRQFISERAQRLLEYETARAENALQRQAELKEAAAAFAEEQKQARESTAQKLRELQEGLNAERLRRREVFLAEIRDLDQYLLGDRDLKNKNYQAMLADAQRFFDQYRASLPGGTSTTATAPTAPAGSGSWGGYFPTRDAGGYMDRGLYRVAWNGAREFALSNSTTKAAERAIGGALTQEGLIRAISGAGRSAPVNYNDYRRMDAPLSKDNRAAFQKAAEEALRFAIGTA